MFGLNSEKITTSTSIDPLTALQQALGGAKDESEQAWQELDVAQKRHQAAAIKQQQIENAIAETLRTQQLEQKEAEIQRQIGVARVLAAEFNCSVRQLMEDYEKLVSYVADLHSQQEHLTQSYRLQFTENYNIENLPIVIHKLGSPKFAITAQAEILNPQNGPALMSEFGSRGPELVASLLIAEVANDS